jgi:DNA-binding NarL/FixJ family response regulator
MHRGIRVLLVGPHQLYLDCIAVAFSATGRFNTLAQASSPDEALEKLRKARPDLLVIDVQMSVQAFDAWNDQRANTVSPMRTLILGSLKDLREILDWIEAGAEGVHLKESTLAELLAGMDQMMHGEVLCPPQLVPSLFSRLAANSARADLAETDGCAKLTPREIEIHTMLKDCLSNKQIASHLHLSLHTVKNHVHNILEKLGVEDRLELIKQAHQKK